MFSFVAVEEKSNPRSAESSFRLVATHVADYRPRRDFRDTFSILRIRYIALHEARKSDSAEVAG